jgi:hypothetical protein
MSLQDDTEEENCNHNKQGSICIHCKGMFCDDAQREQWLRRVMLRAHGRHEKGAEAGKSMNM